MNTILLQGIHRRILRRLDTLRQPLRRLTKVTRRRRRQATRHQGTLRRVPGNSMKGIKAISPAVIPRRLLVLNLITSTVITSITITKIIPTAVSPFCRAVWPHFVAVVCWRNAAFEFQSDSLSDCCYVLKVLVFIVHSHCESQLLYLYFYLCRCIITVFHPQFHQIFCTL